MKYKNCKKTDKLLTIHLEKTTLNFTHRKPINDIRKQITINTR